MQIPFNCLNPFKMNLPCHSIVWKEFYHLVDDIETHTVSNIFTYLNNVPRFFINEPISNWHVSSDMSKCPRYFYLKVHMTNLNEDLDKLCL